MAEVDIPRQGDVDPRTIVSPTGPTFHLEEIKASNEKARTIRLVRTPEQVVHDTRRTESELDEREKRSARLGVPESAMINWLRQSAGQRDQEYAAENLPELQVQAKAEAETAGHEIHIEEHQQ
ncbi:MAG TPA: hypothetical protein VMR95_03700 [Candidatus Binatia bacterium]|jgi:hypothetical protein|nr:hypothetical protein [Candidatus Binatia bacterium]